MADPELNDALDKLHHELEEADDLDDDARGRLLHLMDDIRSVLDRTPPSTEDEDNSLYDQLAENIQNYEASHPSLTAALQHALDILSGAGI